ncbi:hypothetical protein K9M59_00235 [Candidatus Gracilibacteria bacterium]|nr:hypothetical protein [Candidatus Gracilibacteria bacterium]MCF7819011.1 hypothetical protein [Candidatus Gracilibacteria bacterium]
MKKKFLRTKPFLWAGAFFFVFCVLTVSAQGFDELGNGWNNFNFGDFVEVRGSGTEGVFEEGDPVDANSWNKIMRFLRLLRQNLLVGCSGGQMLTGINADGSPRCVDTGTITQQESCDPKPANTIWNISDTFTQTWQGGSFYSSF